MLDKTLVMQEPNVEELSNMIENLILDKNLYNTLVQNSLLSVKNTTWNDYMKKCDTYINSI
jgi:hypothetical protein